jgi:hypothetical protein
MDGPEIVIKALDGFQVAAGRRALLFECAGIGSINPRFLDVYHFHSQVRHTSRLSKQKALVFRAKARAFGMG